MKEITEVLFDWLIQLQHLRPQHCNPLCISLPSNPAWGLHPRLSCRDGFTDITNTFTDTHSTNNLLQIRRDILKHNKTYPQNTVIRTGVQKFTIFITQALENTRNCVRLDHAPANQVLHPIQTAEKRKLTRWPTARRRCLTLLILRRTANSHTLKTLNQLPPNPKAGCFGNFDNSWPVLIYSMLKGNWYMDLLNVEVFIITTMSWNIRLVSIIL